MLQREGFPKPKLQGVLGRSRFARWTFLTTHLAKDRQPAAQKHSRGPESRRAAGDQETVPGALVLLRWGDFKGSGSGGDKETAAHQLAPLTQVPNLELRSVGPIPKPELTLLETQQEEALN